MFSPFFTLRHWHRHLLNTTIPPDGVYCILSERKVEWRFIRCVQIFLCTVFIKNKNLNAASKPPEHPPSQSARKWDNTSIGCKDKKVIPWDYIGFPNYSSELHGLTVCLGEKPTAVEKSDEPSERVDAPDRWFRFRFRFGLGVENEGADAGRNGRRTRLASQSKSSGAKGNRRKKTFLLFSWPWAGLVTYHPGWGPIFLKWWQCIRTYTVRRNRVRILGWEDGHQVLLCLLPHLLVVSWTKLLFSLSPLAAVNLVSRDGFGRPVPRQPTHSPHSGWIWRLWTN